MTEGEALVEGREAGRKRRKEMGRPYRSEGALQAALYWRWFDFAIGDANSARLWDIYRDGFREGNGR